MYLLICLYRSHNIIILFCIHFEFFSVFQSKNNSLAVKRSFILNRFNFFNIKQKILEKKLGYDIELIHIGPGQEKNIVDMNNGIQIDDFYCNLNTNAKTKVLVKNFIDTDYNFVPDIREDLYIVNDWKDIGECLDWFKKEWDLENNFEDYV